MTDFVKLANDRRAGKLVTVTLGSGRMIRLEIYKAGVRAAQAASPQTPVSQTLAGYSGTAGDICRQFRAGVIDRINRHDTKGRGKGSRSARRIRKLCRAAYDSYCQDPCPETLRTWQRFVGAL